MIWDHGQDDFWVYVTHEYWLPEGREWGKIKMELIELGPEGFRPELMLMDYSLEGTRLCWN